LQRADAAEVHLLFAAGKRPDRAAIAAIAGLLEEIAVPDGDRLIRAELLSQGLTFDLGGLMPGPAAAFPAIEHRFDLPAMPSADGFEALALTLGPHLAAGGRSQPVSRGMLGVTCELVRHFDDLDAVCWGPSRSAIGRRFFESVVSAWLDGGAFPALGLCTFAAQADGVLESIGLGFWIGQELRIEPPLSTDKVAATRLGVRIINQLVLTGGIEGDERITAPDGTRLVLRPSIDRALINVWRE
jgi:hypothetical protein